MPRKSDLAGSWDALAAVVETPRRKLMELRHLPGAPKTKSISKWEEFLESLNEEDPEDLDELGLKKEKTKEEIRKLRINNDLKEEVMVNEAKQAAQDLLIAAGKRLRSVLVGLLPARLGRTCAGRPGAEIETLARTLIEDALREAKV